MNHNLSIGARIREYEVLSLLGRGGMGSVYRCRHTLLDEERAIKVVKTNLEDDSAFADRFVREGRLLARLKHRNLVQLYELGKLEEHLYFMVLELLRGESVLKRLRDRGRLAVGESLRIVGEAALGLAEAHDHGVVHRDISPDNLFLERDRDGHEVTKVIDFGIAKPLADDALGVTATDVFVGKLEYASPEQCGLLDEGQALDGRSDVYSLGIVLYHMVTGRLPFQATTPQGYILKHATQLPPPPTRLLASLPDSLERLILKALAKDRRQRHTSMGELAREIKAVEQDVEVRPHVTPRRPRLAIGTELAGRYRIDGWLGEGGMGSVYRAQDTLLNVPLAIKMISPVLARDKRIVDRLRREVVLARRISHPNVCRIHDIGETDGIPYVSMDLAEGQALAYVLEPGIPMPIARVIHIVGQVLEGLGAAHAAGVVHRDLKPGNVMVGSGERVVILDFGVAFAPDIQRLTGTGMIVGTPEFMAPEQVVGDNLDNRVDIYAVGVMLFQMLTGRLPFTGHTPARVLLAHVEQPAPAPSSAAPGVPASIDAIVLRAMAKEPARRQPDVYALLAELRAVVLDHTEPHEMPREVLPTPARGLGGAAPTSDSEAATVLRPVAAQAPGEPEGDTVDDMPTPVPAAPLAILARQTTDAPDVIAGADTVTDEAVVPFPGDFAARVARTPSESPTRRLIVPARDASPAKRASMLLSIKLFDELPVSAPLAPRGRLGSVASLAAHAGLIAVLISIPLLTSQDLPELKSARVFFLEPEQVQAAAHPQSAPKQVAPQPRQQKQAPPAEVRFVAPTTVPKELPPDEPPKLAPIAMEETDVFVESPQEQAVREALANLVRQPDVAPVVMRQTTPRFPAEYVDKMHRGKTQIVLEVLVGADGTVIKSRQLQPLRPDPRLLQAAQECVQQWLFKPAESGGRKVACLTRVSINFEVEVR